ncbi:ribosome maturation factor RimM [Aquirufa rosea]|uniref:Ribosome maturation factor RimM n=1 Tax=Aquirufa rosea TaxID=2509241 RepID=A0A4Q1C1Z7_9BACT|nr:ribosome maturation factor RimM [Aquirufa rosea]RXK52177.1 16S rRNA processing protein RimM [Aquirufa rosea]
MAKTEYFELGTLSKPHGIKGALHVYLDVDDPEEYEGLDAVFLQIGNEMVPYFISDLQIRSNLNLISFEGIESLDAAKDLVGIKLFLPISMLPKLKDHQFYYHEIVGYQVIDVNLGKLGTVKEVYSTGAQDVLVMTYQSKEVLIPLLDEIIPKVDKKNQIINSVLPDGLLEVYLDDEN